LQLRNPSVSKAALLEKFAGWLCACGEMGIRYQVVSSLQEVAPLMRKEKKLPEPA